MTFYYVYVLQNKDSGSLYIGFTRDLLKRVKGHESGDTPTTRGGKYELTYYESYRNKTDALGREKFLKGGSGKKYLKKQLKHYWEEGR